MTIWTKIRLAIELIVWSVIANIGLSIVLWCVVMFFGGLGDEPMPSLDLYSNIMLLVLLAVSALIGFAITRRRSLARLQADHQRPGFPVAARQLQKED